MDKNLEIYSFFHQNFHRILEKYKFMARLSEFPGRMDEAEEGEIFSSPATPETFDPFRQIEAEPAQHQNRPTQQHDESYIDRLIVEAGQAEERRKAGSSQEMLIDEDPDVLRRLALDSVGAFCFVLLLLFLFLKYSKKIIHLDRIIIFQRKRNLSIIYESLLGEARNWEYFELII